MADFRRIVTSSLVMLQVLSFTAEAVTFSFFIVRAGDEVALPCGNVSPGQDKCDRTTWNFIDSGKTVTLFEYGKIHKEAKDESDRLSVLENCSLVIKNVTDEDVGAYFCRRFRSGKPEQHEDALSDLFVVTMTEHKYNDEVTLNCSVSTYRRCGLTVRWLFEDNKKDVMTSQPCSAQLMIKQSQLDQKSYDLLKCEVTDVDSGNVHQFNFSRPQSSDDAATKTTTEPPPTTTTSPSAVTTRNEYENNLNLGPYPTVLLSDWWRTIVVCLGLAALIISVVTVNIWSRSKGNKTRTEETAERNEEEEEEEEDGGPVNYENVGEASASV